MIDLKTVEKRSKPNRWLVAPEAWLENAEPDAPAPTFGASPADLLDLAEKAARSAGAQDLVLDAEAMRLSYVAQVVIFKDDIDIQIPPHPEGSTLAVYSRSRVGYSDFGVNKRRVEDLLRALGNKVS